MAILDARRGREDWYQPGLSVPVKEVSRLVAFCRSSVSLNSVALCSDSYTLEHASAFEGFWKSCARLERDGSSSGQMEGDHASSVLARFLSIGINNLLTTVYKRVALAQGWNKGSLMWDYIVSGSYQPIKLKVFFWSINVFEKTYRSTN